MFERNAGRSTHPSARALASTDLPFKLQYSFSGISLESVKPQNKIVFPHNSC